AGNSGPGSAGNGGPGTAGDTGTGGAATGTGGAMVTPPKNALTDPQPCTTSGTPGPRKMWRLTGPELTASIRTIFGDTAGAAPITTVFNDPVTLGFSVDANSLLVQDLNASQLEDNAEAVAAWAASAGKPAQFASCASST